MTIPDRHVRPWLLRVFATAGLAALALLVSMGQTGRVLGNGRALVTVELNSQPLPTNNASKFVDWTNTTGGPLYLVGIRPWLGASEGKQADLALNVTIADRPGAAPRTVWTDPRDRYAEPNGFREMGEWFGHHYFEVPAGSVVTMEVRGAKQNAEIGEVHGTCLLFFARERP